MQRIKYIIPFLIFIFVLNTGSAQQRKQSELQTKSSLAIRYYNAKDYEKAMPLLQEVYKLTRSTTYFRYYVTCLTELHRYAEAEEAIQNEIKKQKAARPEFYINWGYVLEEQGRADEAKEKYEDAIREIQPNRGSYLTVANAFMGYQKFDMARDAYLKGREQLPDQEFNYELARAYLYLRDYTNMMEEYLNLLKEDEKHLSRVQSSLSSAMRLDIDDGLRDQFRDQVLLRIQSDPDVLGYNRLFIWFLLQEKKFASALRQSIAIDRRTGEEAGQIAQLGDMALRNKQYAEAKKAYKYLMDKGIENSYFAQAFARNLHASYLEFVNETPDDSTAGEELAKQFNEGLEYLKYGPATLNLVREYAHLLTFYLNNTDTALKVLESGLKIPGLEPEQIGVLKTEMADIYVYANDPWEAMLIYSQVIDENKKSSLGDEVKLKKAKLGYYMGNFSWAKAQLDVLKASTSKLTANDAMELSMMIGNNLNLDTTAVPLTMFAKADLLFFQNRNDEAMVILDGLAETYPYHSLVDDILFRKAKLAMTVQDYALAAEYYEAILTDYSYDLLGDDALFNLAEIYNYHLDQKEKARDLYKQMLTAYPGSVYIEESRKLYRELREVYPDEQLDQKTKEELFMEGVKPDEFE
ncbi:tetratricopeptide repeat protein [Maribellus sediminis]|uniref:tetratricopeptide repeat protein n=1 Tax=Maribellus sediminis TaxID=2696285 RepID=UPI001431B0EF|nr:tetratricopeptide repeat protein [Maribellus sediminis]